MKVRWLGEACVEISGEKDLLIDPNYTEEPKIAPEIILITHEHDDHIDPNKIASYNDAEIHAPETVLEKFDLEGSIAEPGKTIADDIRVYSCDCYGAEEAVSYYYAGMLHTADTASFPQVEDNIKLLFTACFSDFYDDYIEGAERLEPDLIIPYHYDPRDEDEHEEAAGLVELFKEADFKARIISPGKDLRI